MRKEYISEEMKVLIQIAEMVRVGMEAIGVEFHYSDGEWTATKKAKCCRKAKEIVYTPEFERFMNVYPQRKPAPNKAETFARWKQRLAEGEFTVTMIEGAERYAKYVRADGKEFTGYVKQPATFLGPQKHYLLKWDISTRPVTKEDKQKLVEKLKSEQWAKMPETISPVVLADFAKTNGYSLPREIRTADDLVQYKRLLKQEIDTRIKESI